MMKKFSFAAVLFSVALSFSCDSNSQCNEKAQVIQSDAANPTLVVINGQAITEQDFNKGLSGREKGAMIKANSDMYEAKKDILDGIVFDKLVEIEAKKKNITSDEYLKKEIDGKIKEVKDKDIQEFYKTIKVQYEKNGKVAPPLNDSVKGQISHQLKMKAAGERRQALNDELFKKNKVAFALEQPRIQVELGMHPIRGGEKAKVTIVEFSDFQCPYCQKGASTMKDVMKKYGNKIKYTFRDFPLSFHDRAKAGANASHCAMEQGKFWEFHDKLFENQQKNKDEDFIALGKDLKLNMAKYEPCVKNMEKIADVEKDQLDGENAGVSGTPAYFINGIFLSGAMPLKKFEEIIDAELKK